MVKWVCRFREQHGFLRGITASTGFPTALVPFERDPRLAGKTQISLRGAVNIALDGVIPFSRWPVRMIFWVGVALLTLAVAGSVGWITIGLWKGLSNWWWVEFLCALSLAMTGLILTSLGVIGEYLVRTYEETRDRPLYIVEEILESDSLKRKTGQVK